MALLPLLCSLSDERRRSRLLDSASLGPWRDQSRRVQLAQALNSRTAKHMARNCATVSPLDCLHDRSDKLLPNALVFAGRALCAFTWHNSSRTSLSSPGCIFLFRLLHFSGPGHCGCGYARLTNCRGSGPRRTWIYLARRNFHAGIFSSCFSDSRLLYRTNPTALVCAAAGRFV